MAQLLSTHLLELLLAAAATLLMLAAALRLRFRAAGAIAIGCLLLGAGYAGRCAMHGDWERVSSRITGGLGHSMIGAGVRLSPLAGSRGAVEPYAFAAAGEAWAWWLVVLVLVAGALAALLALQSLPRKGGASVEFFALLLFAAAGLSLLARSADFITLFLGLETASIALYCLTATLREREKSLEAAFKYFVLGAVAAALLLFGAALLYGATGRFDFAGVFSALRGDGPWHTLAAAGLALVTVALAFKTALAPFHMWAPDAYSGAPTPVAGFMMVATKAAVLGAGVRIAMELHVTGATVHSRAGLMPLWVGALTLLGLFTLLTGNTVALVQRRYKRLIGYSAVASGGFTALALTVAAGAPTEAERASLASALVFYLASYLLTTFGLLAALQLVEGDAHLDAELKEFTGIGRERPFSSAALAILLLSAAGLPGTAGFLGKFSILRELLRADRPLVAAVAILLTVAGAAYYLRILMLMYMRPRDPDEQYQPWRSGRTEFAIIGICAILTLLLGFAPGLLPLR